MTTRLLSMLAKSGLWLEKKRNFYLYSVLGMGVPSSILLTWWLGDVIRHPLWGLFLAAVAFLASFLWGFLMWHLFYRHVIESTTQKAGKDDAA